MRTMEPPATETFTRADRYKSFPARDDDHFHTVCRYVERNALTANLVKRAEDYRWGSLYNSVVLPQSNRNGPCVA